MRVMTSCILFLYHIVIIFNHNSKIQNIITLPVYARLEKLRSILSPAICSQPKAAFEKASNGSFSIIMTY